jgi:hypothetical protein
MPVHNSRGNVDELPVRRARLLTEHLERDRLVHRVALHQDALRALGDRAAAECSLEVVVLREAAEDDVDRAPRRTLRGRVRRAAAWSPGPARRRRDDSRDTVRLADDAPFPADREHAAYDRDAAERFWRILDWTDGVFEEFAGWYCGKTSPVHVFWHSLDLAVTRFSGKRAPAMPEADLVTREAYSHEAISFGFWAGDEKVPEPTYYSYTAPEPSNLREQRLQPEEAAWGGAGGALALLSYEAVRVAADPRATLLAFLESAYEAGASTAGWDAAVVSRPAQAERPSRRLKAPLDSDCREQG